MSTNQMNIFAKKNAMNDGVDHSFHKIELYTTRKQCSAKMNRERWQVEENSKNE
jgi:hypothetical protein